MNIQASVSTAWTKSQGIINGLILLLPNIMLALIGQTLGSVSDLLIDFKLINLSLTLYLNVMRK
jgi:hypothetical protein